MQVAASRLNTVIKVRKFQVKKAQRELAQIQLHREKEQNALTKLEETKDTAVHDAVKELKSRVADLQTSRAFIQNLSRQIRQQSQKVDTIHDQEDGKREELVGKEQSKRMLEKLDAKRQDEVEKELDRKTQRLVDVLAQRMKTKA